MISNIKPNIKSAEEKKEETKEQGFQKQANGVDFNVSV